MGSVICELLGQLMESGKPANIRKKNGFFYNGAVLRLDETHVEIKDRKLGPVVILISDIAEARESIVGGDGNGTR